MKDESFNDESKDKAEETHIQTVLCSDCCTKRSGVTIQIDDEIKK